MRTHHKLLRRSQYSVLPFILWISLLIPGCSSITSAPEVQSIDPEAVLVTNVEANAEKPVNTEVNTEIDVFRDAVNKAMEAAELVQLAKTSEDWSNVASVWKQAIDLMKAVPVSSPSYETAQKKALEYQSNVEYAQRNTANTSIAVAPEETKSALDIQSLVGVEYVYPQSLNFIENYGQPETLAGTNNSRWVAYFSKGDFTIVTDKRTNVIQTVVRGRTPQ